MREIGARRHQKCEKLAQDRLWADSVAPRSRRHLTLLDGLATPVELSLQSPATCDEFSFDCSRLQFRLVAGDCKLGKVFVAAGEKIGGPRYRPDVRSSEETFRHHCGDRSPKASETRETGPGPGHWKAYNECTQTPRGQGHCGASSSKCVNYSTLLNRESTYRANFSLALGPVANGGFLFKQSFKTEFQKADRGAPGQNRPVSLIVAGFRAGKRSIRAHTLH